MGIIVKTNEVDYINNCTIEHLYNSDFGNGKFFYVVFDDNDTTDIKLSKKIKMRIVFKPSKNDIEGLKIIKTNNDNIEEEIHFSQLNIQQLKSFLQFITQYDLNTIAERKLKLADDTFDIIDDETKKKITTLFKGNEGEELIKNLLENEVVTSQDIINTAYRKTQLNIFDKLLTDEKYLQQYKKEEKEISTLISEFETKHQKTIDEKSKDEIAWQYFFNKNPWIFGYGLDYRFEKILQKEFSASDTDASGKGQVNTDFLIGDNNFTTFVEIKKPDTDIFDNKINRSGSWRLSKELTYAVSQILEQKTRGQIKTETTRNLPLSDGSYLKQHSYDSKCVLIFGNLEQEIKHCNDTEIDIMKKTFELYRRNSKNIDIITYDELYNRAFYICNKK
ncbi:DUF4263 domain-containing protein [Flavobacterium psychrophilum]|uniref:Shedu immune nuclease family protein n=1 Tax=Flavobacterium psychrophilum TaxID=96345 RepID=UPI000B7C222A|nr:Shedu immune nuclease family protein [Flavobacterium psychrophilum]MCB6229675.1 DUF4263 domain-containing protein [Flavobacterium psychrophilum]SNA86765.1 conserved hypothetical protein [Flavobacterium psychrophilum]